MSRLRIKPGPPRWEASTLAKIYSNSMFIATPNIYIWAHDNFLYNSRLMRIYRWIVQLNIIYRYPANCLTKSGKTEQLTCRRWAAAAGRSPETGFDRGVASWWGMAKEKGRNRTADNKPVDAERLPPAGRQKPVLKEGWPRGGEWQGVTGRNRTVHPHILENQPN